MLSWEEDTITCFGKAGVLPTEGDGGEKRGEATEKKGLVLGADELCPSEICCLTAPPGGIACTNGAHPCLMPLSPLLMSQFPLCSPTACGGSAGAECMGVGAPTVNHGLVRL